MSDKATRRRPADEPDDQFYEALPGLADEFYYAQIDDEFEPERHYDDPDHEHMARMTAIITILLATVVAAGLAILLFKGISTFDQLSASPAGQSQTR